MAFDTETPLLEHFFTEVKSDKPVEITKKNVIDLQDDDKMFDEPLGEVITQEHFDSTSIQHLLKRVSLASDHLVMACEAYSEILCAEKDPFSHNPDVAVAKARAVYAEIHKPYTPKNFALESVAYRSVIATESENQKSLIGRIFESIAKAISWILTKIAKLFGFSKDSKKSEKISKDTEKTKDKIEEINKETKDIVKENSDIPEVQHARLLTTIGDMLHKFNEVDKFRKKYAELNGTETPVLNAYRRLSYYVSDLDAHRLADSINSVKPAIHNVTEIERAMKIAAKRLETLIQGFKNFDASKFEADVETYIREIKTGFQGVRQAFNSLKKAEHVESVFSATLFATTVDRDLIDVDFRVIDNLRYDDKVLFAIADFAVDIEDGDGKKHRLVYDTYATVLVHGDKKLDYTYHSDFRYNVDDLFKIKFADESGQKAILSAIESVTKAYYDFEDERQGFEESIKELCAKFASTANDFKSDLEKFEQWADRPIRLDGFRRIDPLMCARPFSQICKTLTHSLNGMVELAVAMPGVPGDAISRCQAAKNWALYSAEANRLYIERLASENKKT